MHKSVAIEHNIYTFPWTSCVILIEWYSQEYRVEIAWGFCIDYAFYFSFLSLLRVCMKCMRIYYISSELAKKSVQMDGLSNLCIEGALYTITIIIMSLNNDKNWNELLCFNWINIVETHNEWDITFTLSNIIRKFFNHFFNPHLFFINPILIPFYILNIPKSVLQ